jgi:D-3-phosphoglycerate dehydrogenase / 2-oxoglutarate reductase
LRSKLNYMIKILVNDGMHPYGQQLLEEANFQVDTQTIAQDDLPEALPDYNVIIVRSATKVRKELIDKCPNLKIIARGGVGLDNIDVSHAKSKNIEVINTPAASSPAVAELAFAHMFAISRFLYQSNREMPASGDTQFKNLKKAYSKGTQLREKTLGIIGFGRIGQETARIGLALGMNVMPVDLVINETNLSISLYNNKDINLTVRVPTVSWDTMLANSDFISLHVPFGGKALIGAKEFEKMKDGVVIINASRGGTIDEVALLEALNSRKVAGAGLDVFENEPTPLKALLEHPRVSLSPHIGASTLEAQRNIGIELAEKIIAYYNGNGKN